MNKKQLYNESGHLVIRKTAQGSVCQKKHDRNVSLEYFSVQLGQVTLGKVMTLSQEATGRLQFWMMIFSYTPRLNKPI